MQKKANKETRWSATSVEVKWAARDRVRKIREIKRFFFFSRKKDSKLKKTKHREIETINR